MQEKLTKKQKRDAARAENKIKLAQAKKSKAKKKTAFVITTILTVTSIAVIVVVSFLNAPKPIIQTNPANMKADAVVFDGGKVVQSAATAKGSKPTPISLTEKKVEVEIYYDYLCPFCRQFEAINRGVISKYIQNPNFVFAFHPMAFLGEYSMIAANATACIAEKKPELWLQANNLLYDNQPEETAAKSFSTKQSIDLVNKSLDSMKLPANILKCIKDIPHGEWSVNATNRMLKGPVPNSSLSTIEGTPTILIDGKVVELKDIPDAASFDKLLAEALKKATK